MTSSITLSCPLWWKWIHEIISEQRLFGFLFVFFRISSNMIYVCWYAELPLQHYMYAIKLNFKGNKSDQIKPYLSEVVWCARYCCWYPQEACPWTMRSLGLGFHWQHTTLWQFWSFRPPLAGGPYRWWESHEEPGSLKMSKKANFNFRL